MAISLASLRTSVSKLPIILMHGVPGVGKTTTCADGPNPVFIQCEDGLGDLQVQTFGLLRTYDEVMQAIAALCTEEHDRKTLVVDSVDSFEALVWAKACAVNGWKSIEDAGYGKGYMAAMEFWNEFMEAVRYLRDERDMIVCLIAHTAVSRFDSPEHEPYDRYVIKLHKHAQAMFMEHCDIVAFANYRVSTVKTDAGFNKKITRGVGGGDRVLYFSERPAFLAKNRHSLPESVPVPKEHPWSALAQHIPMLAGATTTTHSTTTETTEAAHG
jgi:hypothetical protein